MVSHAVSKKAIMAAVAAAVLGTLLLGAGRAEGHHRGTLHYYTYAISTLSGGTSVYNCDANTATSRPQ